MMAPTIVASVASTGTRQSAGRSLKVLLVHQYYYPYIGGAESIFKGLAERLVQRGHRVRVITTRLHDTPSFEVVNGVGVERIATPTSGDRYFFTALGVPAVLRRAARCDVIQTGPYNGAIAAFLGGRLRRRPIVFTSFEVLGKRWAEVEPNPLVAGFYERFELAVSRLP